MGTGWGRFAAAVVVIALLAMPAGAQGEPPQLVLIDVAHALEGPTLVVTGRVHNRGAQPRSGLIIDVSGFSPAGDLSVFGSDGIPWTIRPDGTERFSVRLPVPRQLVRDYVLHLSLAGAPQRPLTGVRRSIDVGLYRPLLMSLVQVEGEVSAGVLTVRSRTAGLPVQRVTAEATVLIVQPQFNQLDRLTLDLRGDSTTAVTVGGLGAFLVSLRLVDILLRVSWE
jgi:hypothetical protein